MGVLSELRKTSARMSFYPSATESDLAEFEQKISFALPEDFKNFLRESDGGEIFDSSTFFYGVCVNKLDSIYAHNQPELRRDQYRVPKQYLIIGKTNYGNLLCFEQGNNRLIEWDPETRRVFMWWDSFTDCINREIALDKDCNFNAE